jgi:hypothetical protein
MCNNCTHHACTPSHAHKPTFAMLDDCFVSHRHSPNARRNAAPSSAWRNTTLSVTTTHARVITHSQARTRTHTHCLLASSSAATQTRASTSRSGNAFHPSASATCVRALMTDSMHVRVSPQPTGDVSSSSTRRRLCGCTRRSQRAARLSRHSRRACSRCACCRTARARPCTRTAARHAAAPAAVTSAT